MRVDLKQDFKCFFFVLCPWDPELTTTIPVSRCLGSSWVLSRMCLSGHTPVSLHTQKYSDKETSICWGPSNIDIPVIHIAMVTVIFLIPFLLNQLISPITKVDIVPYLFATIIKFIQIWLSHRGQTNWTKSKAATCRSLGSSGIHTGACGPSAPPWPAGRPEQNRGAQWAAGHRCASGSAAPPTHGAHSSPSATGLSWWRKDHSQDGTAGNEIISAHTHTHTRSSHTRLPH